MKTFTALLVLLVALPAFAGRVITYTAVSERSQEDANNAAMAGVAKQIVSQVDSRQVLTKKESKSGKNSNLDESFFSSNSVKSNIKLKGVKLERSDTAVYVMTRPAKAGSAARRANSTVKVFIKGCPSGSVSW